MSASDPKQTSSYEDVIVGTPYSRAEKLLTSASVSVFSLPLKRVSKASPNFDE